MPVTDRWTNGAGFRFAVVSVVLLSVACTFERRPDPSDEVVEESETQPPATEEERAADSVRLVQDTFRDAMDAGDLSRALSLVDPGAVILDRFVDLDPETASRGEILLEVLRLEEEGVALEPVESQVSLFQDAALVVTRYQVHQVGEEVEESVPSGFATETLLLVRGEEGWRIHHLHRSLGGDGAP